MKDKTYRPKGRLRWLEGERARHRSGWLGYNVTIFNTLGQYPEGTHMVPGGVFHADPELVFSVVWGGSWQRLDAELPYSELRGLSPDCLRLVAALMLCERRGERRCNFYPETEHRRRLDTRRLRLDRAEVVGEIRQFLLEDLSNCTDSQGGRLPYKPSRKYDLFDPSQLLLDRLLEFWEAFNPPDYLVLRGMHALMKADMLACHREFQEEATIACFIALDASFSKIQQELVNDGARNPSAHDVAKWVHAHFNEAFGIATPGPEDKYFGDLYEQRVMTLHPSSRYGETPVAPILYGDYMWLRRDLREVFAYLITRHHGPDYNEDLRTSLRRAR
ncbi:hypothetical protein GCM10009121_11860 [Rhodanobacter soli]